MGIARVVYRSRESNTATSISTALKWCHNASESHVHVSFCLLFDFWKVVNISTLNIVSINPSGKMASLVAQLVKSLPTMETWVQFLGPLEKGVATHFSILAWEISWIEEPGGLQFTGLQRVKHDSHSIKSLYETVCTRCCLKLLSFDHHSITHLWIHIDKTLLDAVRSERFRSGQTWCLQFFHVTL